VQALEFRENMEEREEARKNSMERIDEQGARIC
jgi:hypothetical protein